jgi:hypothetical protein
MLKATIIALLALACGIELMHINYHEQCIKTEHLHCKYA